jgi:hypothetical protein
VGKGPSLIQQANRAFDGRLTQVHVSLRRREILVTGELLNGPSRRPAQMSMIAQCGGQANRERDVPQLTCPLKSATP